MKTNSNKTNNQMGKTCSFLTKREQREPLVTRLQKRAQKTSDKETSVKTNRNYQKTRYLEYHKERNIGTYTTAPLVRV